MVLTQESQDNQEKAQESRNKNQSAESKSSSPQKIFTCSELEGREKMSTATPNATDTLKDKDSAIVTWSVKNSNLTRYDKAELLAIKDHRLSQEVPQCLYEPNVIRLSILKYKKQRPEEVEKQMNEFRDKLQNVNAMSFDPNIAQVLNSYHSLILNPGVQSPNAMNNTHPQISHQQQQFASIHNQLMSQLQQQSPQQNTNIQQFYPPPRQSQAVDQQKVILDKMIPPYDRKNHFFDNITTTATMKPPAPRMGIGSFYFQKHRTNYRKPVNYNNSSDGVKNHSSGYFTGNDTVNNDDLQQQQQSNELQPTRNEKSELALNENKEAESLEKLLKDDEEEPEWFRYDFDKKEQVDLSGFDPMDLSPKKNISNGNGGATTNCEYKKGYFNNNNNNNYNGYPQQQPSRFDNSPSMHGHRRPIVNNSYANNRNYNSSHVSASPGNMSSGFNQSGGSQKRFRNPIHYQQQQQQKRNTSPVQANYGASRYPKNPFFEVWKSQKVPSDKMNFSLLHNNPYMSQFNSSAPPAANVPMMTMNEIENTMKQQQQQNQFIMQAQQQQQQQAANNAQSVNSFFETIANNYRQNDGYKIQMPTQEQLQQHTSEIMRNAILRKSNNNQQYHE